MFRIALCDDEENQLKQVSGLLEAYLQAHPGLKGQVETFREGKALLERAGKAPAFDLYVLDILMPEHDGIETGRRLRPAGDRGEIIYLTNSNDFAADSYDVRAFFYLLKPVAKDKLFHVLDEAVKKHSRQRQQKSKCIIVATADGSQRVPLEKILYAERMGRCVRYNCTDAAVDSQTIRVSFREAVAPLLADRRFCLCGASFVVNFQHVAGVNGQTALLDNGLALSLPRSASDFKQAWGNYWLEEDPY